MLIRLECITVTHYRPSQHAHLCIHSHKEAGWLSLWVKTLKPFPCLEVNVWHPLHWRCNKWLFWNLIHLLSIGVSFVGETEFLIVSGALHLVCSEMNENKIVTSHSILKTAVFELFSYCQLLILSFSPEQPSLYQHIKCFITLPYDSIINCCLLWIHFDSS